MHSFDDLVAEAVGVDASVRLVFRDDGRGIDRARVRAKAEANGLIQPDQALTEGSSGGGDRTLGAQVQAAAGHGEHRHQRQHGHQQTDPEQVALAIGHRRNRAGDPDQEQGPPARGEELGWGPHQRRSGISTEETTSSMMSWTERPPSCEVVEGSTRCESTGWASTWTSSGMA